MQEFERIKISDDDINRIIEGELRRAEDWAEELSEERERCDDLYHRRLLGNEEDGFSQYVSSVVFDTVNWLLPGMVDIFTHPDFFVVRMDDSDKADNVKKLLRYQLFSQQDGAKAIREFVFAALKYHNGTFKIYYDEDFTEETEIFDHLSEAEFMRFQQAEQERPDDLTISDFTRVEDTLEGEPIVYYENVKAVKKVYEYRGPRLEAIPPWEFLVSPGVPSVDEATLVCHRKRTTFNDIMLGEQSGKFREGSTKKAMKNGANDIDVADLREERELQYTRDNIDISALDEYNDQMPNDPVIEPNRIVYVDEIYTRLDIDGDGLLEPVIIWKTGDVILNIVENPYGRPPFREGCIFEDLARREGKALPLMLMDDQIEATNLRRIFIDSSAESAYGTMVSNDPEFLGQWADRGVGDSILATQFGGAGKSYDVIRPDQPGETLIKAQEMVRTDHERRTGVNSLNQGLTSENMGKTATGTVALQNAGQQRQKLYATILGETLRYVIKDFIWINRTWKPAGEVKILGQQALSVDPNDLDGDADVQVEVGVGPNDRIMKAQQLEGHYEKLVTSLIPSGAAGPEHLIKCASKIGKLYGQNTDDLMFSPEEFNTVQQMQQQMQQMGQQLQAMQAQQGALPQQGAPAQPQQPQDQERQVRMAQELTPDEQALMQQ